MPKLEGLRVLVIGANGFIGSHLVRALIRKNAIVVAGTKPGGNPRRISEESSFFQAIPLDLLDPENLNTVLRSVRPEIVFNCAASRYSPKTPLPRLDEFRISTIGAFYLAEALCLYPPRLLINISTLQECQPINGIHPSDRRFDPITFRGAAKSAGTLLLRQMGIEKGFQVMTLRFSSIFGPWQQPDRLIPTAIRAALAGTSLPMVQSIAARDFLYIDDAVSACLLAAATEAADLILAVGSGVFIPIRTVVEKIFRMCGASFDIFPSFPDRAYDLAFGAADIAFTKTCLDWEPKFSLCEGLQRTIEWQQIYDIQNKPPCASN